MTRNVFLAGLATIAMLAFAMPAEAATVEFTDGYSVAIDEAQSPGPVAPDPATDATPLAATINEDALSDLAGQGDAPVGVLTEQALTALNSGNSIVGTNVGSGAISINQDAISGFSGIGNFVINSGHNNTLQSSLSVSIVITQ